LNVCPYRAKSVLHRRPGVDLWRRQLF
jgi:hypothetical protein